MAIQVLKDQKIWFDGYDLTGILNAIALENGCDTPENTVFGQDTHTVIGGLKTVKASVQGFVNASTKDKALFDKIGVGNIPLSFAAQNATEGNPAYSFLTTSSEYTNEGAVGDMFGFKFNAEASSLLTRGTLMENNSAITFTGAGTARQVGAVASGKKIYAILHVLAVNNPVDDLDVTIESNANNSFSGSETTRITFNTMSAIGSQWIELAGPITDTWWRAAYDVAGSTPSFDFIVILAIL